MSRVTILDVFPGHFDQNGDSGNVLALRRRLEWSGFDVVVSRVAPGDAWPVETPDFVLVGGGSIPAQRDALPHLMAARVQLQDWVASGVAYLAVAGGYTLSATQTQMPGEDHTREALALFAGVSTALPSLQSGTIAFRSSHYGVLHGYVNLAQRVVLDDASQCLGMIEVGPWPGAVGEPEGAQVGSAFGTHAHGPILPKNPVLADAIIWAGLTRRGLESRYVHGARHEQVDALARRARASLAARLEQAPPD